jgi:RNA polymerase sigma factor (sigma-70 family)
LQNISDTKNEKNLETSLTTAAEIYQTYGPKLLELARRQLSSKLSRRVDPEDILQSVFRSFFSRETPQEPSAGELWGYLIQSTLNKVRRVGRRNSAKKRDQAREEYGSNFEELTQPTPTICDIVIMSEELAWLQRQLCLAQRQCLELRLQGCDSAEIAEACQTTDRTIRRWLRGIGELLQFRHAQSTSTNSKRPRTPVPNVAWPAGVRICRYDEFVVEQMLGTGSMCKAFRARRVDTGEQVCLKILRQTWRDHPEHRQQLLAECEFLQGVKHPAIVPLLGAGQMPSGSLYLVLHWIEGQSLASYLNASNADQVEAKLQEVATLLIGLHSQGFTHGDLHAGNVLMGQGGQLWFTDFRPTSQGVSAEKLELCIQADWDAFARMSEYNL